jgi:chromosomal replication initiation ATPase DnaA
MEMNVQKQTNSVKSPAFQMYRVDNIKPRPPKRVELEDILVVVSKVTKVEMQMITSKSRKRNYVQARQIYSWLAWYYTTKSLVKIGEPIGGRHHTSIIHGRDSVNDFIQYDKPFQILFADVMTEFKNAFPFARVTESKKYEYKKYNGSSAA